MPDILKADVGVKKTRVLHSIDVSTVQTWPCYSKSGTVVTALAKTMQFTVNENTSTKPSYRLVYFGKNIVDLFYASGITSTINGIVTTNTIKEIETEITKLGIHYSAANWNADKTIYGEDT